MSSGSRERSQPSPAPTRALRSAPVRALVVSNMLADAAHPERGRFVRDQVDALRTLDGVNVGLYEFPPGARAGSRHTGPEQTLRGRTLRRGARALQPDRVAGPRRESAGAS